MQWKYSDFLYIYLNWRFLPTLLIALMGLWWGLSGSVYAEEYSLIKQEASQNTGKVRVFHFALQLVTTERARWMVDKAEKAGFNAIQVLLINGVHFDNSPWKSYPARWTQEAWSKVEFKEWTNYARKKGMMVIPEIKLLTHQENFFQDRFPDLMFNASTYDPRQEVVYTKWVFPLLQEIIDLIEPRAIHIGHDEAFGWNTGAWKINLLRDGEIQIPASLFLSDVLRIYNYLKKRNVETWMWGDMLISPKEFPSMRASNLHGSSKGYGKDLRDKLPRDIVICTWHYLDEQLMFPSLSVMQSEGFRVIGVTWKNLKTIRNFSRYAAQHDAYGMMATTWFHVQKREWGIVEKIIKNSGKEFQVITKP